MDYEVVKAQGKHRYTHHKQTQSTGLRSLNWWGSNNKARGLRRIADRHSHHRRRNHVRNQIASGRLEGIESLPPKSSTKRMGCEDGWSQIISNRKMM